MPDRSAALLARLSEAYWNELLEFSPTYASALGYRQHDHRLPDMGPVARERHFRALEGLLTQLNDVDAHALNAEDRVTLEVLLASVQIERDAEPHLSERWTVNPLFGTHVWLAELSQRQPTQTAEELGRLQQRFEGIKHLLDQEMVSLREGIAHKQTAFQISVDRSVAQLDRLLSTDPMTSAFVPPSTQGQSAERTAGLATLAEVVRDQVFPALKGYRDFLANEYLPAARSTPGMNSIDGGADYYAYCVRTFTGIARSPEEIHQRGLDELERLHAEMLAVAGKVSGMTDVYAFAQSLKARPDQTFATREELLAFNQQIMARAEAALPDWFSSLPSRKCEVRLIDAYREADSPAGYYDRAPDDGSRPAYYYVNGHDPSDRPRFNMEALAFHEAVPGHHLQIATAQELTSLPMVRRHMGDTAFIEGWALYTERLADEMGLYTDDIARFGMLGFQAWRAARLVLDTGLHAMGWQRQQAIDFLVNATGHSRTEATIEVDRYICMPGQALAYMLGRMEIDSLRKQAEDAFGPRFDIKEFHEQVLGHGALPLASLNGVISRWIAAAS